VGEGPSLGRVELDRTAITMAHFLNFRNLWSKAVPFGSIICSEGIQMRPAIRVVALLVSAFAAPFSHAQPSTTTSLAIKDKSLPNAVANTGYSYTLVTSGGTRPYVWSLASGSSLPPGLALNTAGQISGIATAVGSYSFTVQVRSEGKAASTAEKELSIVVGPSLAIRTVSVQEAVATVSYSQTLAAIGGTAPYSWSLASGALPAGLALSSSGAISGTPTVPGTYSIMVEVGDSSAPAPLRTREALTIVVVPVLTITTGSLPGGIATKPYAGFNLTAAGGRLPLTWSLAPGSALPPGLTLTPAGTISGTPETPGTHNLTVQAADRTSPVQVATKALSITVASPLTITATSLPNGVAPSAYSQTVTVANGTGPYTWTWSLAPAMPPSAAPASTAPQSAAPSPAAFGSREPKGEAPRCLPPPISPQPSLPPGLTLNSSTGSIAGTPTVPGTYKVVLEVSDGGTPTPQTATRTISLAVSPSFSGHVYTPKGAPIPGAVVEAIDPTGASISAVTDPDGNFSLPLSTGKYTVSAWAPDYQAQAVQLTANSTAQSQEFRLNAGRTGGQFYRIILGGQQVGASATQGVQKLFGDLYAEIPGPPLGRRRPTDMVYGNRLRFWGSVRLTSIPQPAPVQLTNVDLGKLVSNLNTSQLAQSIAFLWGPEFRIFSHPPSPPGTSVYVGPNNNTDDTRGGQKFTGSIIIGLGAETPIQPQSSATLVNAAVGDAQKLYHDITGNVPDPKYTSLALISQDRSRFLRQYFVGFRLKTHYFTAAGIPITRPPAILDVALGQNEVVTDGHLHGGVLRFEGFFPMPYKLSMFYLFGRAYLRLSGNPRLTSSYALAPAEASATFPSATVAPLTLPPPNRDIYSFGIGMDLLSVVGKLIKP